MSKHTKTITSNTDIELCTGGRGTNMDMFEATVHSYGSFDGGTLTLQLSTDGGTTKTNLRDTSGNLVQMTAADVFNIRLGYAGKNGEEPIIYANMASATSPDVTIDILDNK